MKNVKGRKSIDEQEPEVVELNKKVNLQRSKPKKFKISSQAFNKPVGEPKEKCLSSCLVTSQK